MAGRAVGSSAGSQAFWRCLGKSRKLFPASCPLDERLGMYFLGVLQGRGWLGCAQVPGLMQQSQGFGSGPTTRSARRAGREPLDQHFKVLLYTNRTGRVGTKAPWLCLASHLPHIPAQHPPHCTPGRNTTGMSGSWIG